MQQELFAGAPGFAPEDQRLIEQYEKTGRTLDALPYTPEFEAMYQSLAAGGDRRERREIFHRLHNLRKASRLPRLGRTEEPPVRLAPEDETALSELVAAKVGSLGQRDRLPYTPDFDDVLVMFNERTTRQLDPYTLWRLIAKLAK